MLPGILNHSIWMSKTPLITKTLQPYPEQSKISELHEFTFQSIFGSLRQQFSLGPFYKFVALSPMVLYQLEPIHLDDSNFIYSQNKNRGFTNILTTIPLKTQHSPLYFFIFFLCSNLVSKPLNFRAYLLSNMVITHT